MSASEDLASIRHSLEVRLNDSAMNAIFLTTEESLLLLAALLDVETDIAALEKQSVQAAKIEEDGTIICFEKARRIYTQEQRRTL